jgi:steroid delta-isomerase-like uncharacterized protein
MAASTSATTIERNKAVAWAVLDRISAGGEMDAAAELVAPDYVDHEAPASMPPGRDELVAVAAWLRSAFPDLRYSHEDTIAEGDRVVTRAVFRGTQRGEYLGVPPTGREVAWKHLHIWRIAEGKVAEHWACRDDVGLFAQLGRPVG